MGNKYTATFSCDRELWDAFKSWSKQRNSSASQEISNFMLSCISSKENISHLYQEKENLESLLRKLVIEELDLRAEEQDYTDYTDDTDGAINTDDTDSTDNTEALDLNQLLTDLELKEKENLTCHKSTITRWRKGRGKIPDLILKKYQVVGSRWKYLGE